MKKYALVNGDHVRYADLRETPKFLMSECASKYKFKKVDGQEFIASNRGFSNWVRTGYDVYEINHPHVLETIQNKKKGYFVFHVREKIEKLYRNRDMTFKEAKKINELLEFGVEL